MNSKKFLAGVLAAAMALSLTACGGGDSSTPSTSTPDASTGDSSTPAADGAITIKVGGIGPLTGSTATYGVATHYGAQVAVDEINALDSDIKLELRFEDDTGVNETGVSAYNTLKDWDVDVIYGTTTTGPCVAVAAETYADRYFQLTPSASSPDVTDGKDNVFQMCFTDPNQGLTAANYVADNNLATKVAVIYNNGDAYSTGIAQGFIAQAAERGLEVVTEQTFPADTTTDFNVQLAACRDGGAELVFMPIYYGPASLVLQQANAMGYDPQFFGGDGMDGILAIEGFDTSLAEGLMLLTPFNATAEDERTVTFVASYKALSGSDENPNQFAADGYDCMYAIYEALQQIDNLEEIAAMDPAERHTALCDALIVQFAGEYDDAGNQTAPGISVDGLTGSGMTWQANGEVSKDPMVVTVENGAYVSQ